MSIPELPHLINRRATPKETRYGNIPGLPVGSRFTDRAHLYNSGMHVTLQAGIQGRAETGACSVVLSGGYEDDVDMGYEFTYTGHGGQLPRQNTDRSQKKDQEWKRGNQALKMSCILKKPVRVIRGHTLHSEWAPTEGYRYDGLYDVVEYDRNIGKSGFYVCLFRFLRRPDQPPLPEDWYRAGERPPEPRPVSLNRPQAARTPPPRGPPPRYSPPPDIKAILEAARNRSTHTRRKSIPETSFKEGSSRERPSSFAGPTTRQAQMSVSAIGEREKAVSQRRQLPSFTKPSAPSNRAVPYPNTIHSSKSEGSTSSSIRKEKERQRATEPEETGRPAKESQKSDSSSRIQAWHRYYNEEPRSQPDENDDSDTDGGEFSEGEGVIYTDEASDTEQRLKMDTNYPQWTPPSDRPEHEVTYISSDEE